MAFTLEREHNFEQTNNVRAVGTLFEGLWLKKAPAKCVLRLEENERRKENDKRARAYDHYVYVKLQEGVCSKFLEPVQENDT